MVIYILKPPLCWKQLNHTKDNQSSNTRKQAGCLMDNVNIRIGTEQAKSDDFGIYWATSNGSS